MAVFRVNWWSISLVKIIFFYPRTHWPCFNGVRDDSSWARCDSIYEIMSCCDHTDSGLFVTFEWRKFPLWYCPKYISMMYRWRIRYCNVIYYNLKVMYYIGDVVYCIGNFNVLRNVCCLSDESTKYWPKLIPIGQNRLVLSLYDI